MTFGHCTRHAGCTAGCLLEELRDHPVDHLFHLTAGLKGGEEEEKEEDKDDEEEEEEEEEEAEEEAEGEEEEEETNMREPRIVLSFLF